MIPFLQKLQDRDERASIFIGEGQRADKCRRRAGWGLQVRLERTLLP